MEAALSNGIYVYRILTVNGQQDIWLLGYIRHIQTGNVHSNRYCNSEVEEPTRCDRVCSFYNPNMVLAPICPSSGGQLLNIFRF
jgi:hypothetical protein